MVYLSSMNTKAQNLIPGQSFRDGTVHSVSRPFMENGARKVAVTYIAPGVLGGLIKHTEHVLSLALIPQV